MKYIQSFFVVVIFLIGAPAIANDANDPFQEIAAKYRAANPKPKLPEEVRKYRVQADFMVKQNQFRQAADLYAKGLELAPWWPQGHYDRGFILGELKQYREAMQEMKRYLALVPNAPDARAVQDQIYQWETVVPDMSKLKEFQDCPDCPVMVAVPLVAVGFDMGSNNGDHPYENPVHRVTIGKAFAIGKTEVTQGQWKAIMGNNPSHFSDCGDTCPVDQVSWNDAKEYIQKLNARTGKQYRLPSEAEWEYACRAGEQQEYCGSDNADSVAWYHDNSGNRTHPVGQKQANGYGLFDMSGNVFEWVEDSYHGNYSGAPVDGAEWPGDGVVRVIRGGSWNGDAGMLRASYRYGINPSGRGSGYGGFRLARMLP